MTARAGSTPRRRAASRNASGAGLPLSPRPATSIPSTRTSNNRAIPAVSNTAAQFLLAETTAVLICWARSFSCQDNRRLICLDALLLQNCQEIPVLAIAQRLDALHVRAISGRPSRQVDAARFEEGRRTVVAGLPFEVAPIVRANIKRHEWLAEIRGPLLKKCIEQTFPGSRIGTCRLRQNPVQIEQDSVVILRRQRYHGADGGHHRVSPFLGQSGNE